MLWPSLRTQVWRMLLTSALAVGLGVAAIAPAERMRASEIVICLPDASTPSQKANAAASQKTYPLRIEDVQGSYTIPFIQSKRELSIRIEFKDAAVATCDVRLLRAGKELGRTEVTRQQPSLHFADLGPGEYSLQCRGLDGDVRQRCCVVYDRIGIGTVIAALGDSITEGYFSHAFKQTDLNLTSERFPKESVSRDGRNFPQFAPTSARHLPSVNCFESWMTPLNNSLTDAWRQPVFIANEGWGGITTGGYLAMMRSDAGWKQRMHQLQPQVWLVHLGVNDERAAVPADVLRTNLTAMVDLLIKDYDVKPARIFLAIPSYDYFPGAVAILRRYATAIEGLIKDRGLSRGPDFFAAFSQEKRRWYGDDPVHPNLEGMAHMARLWHEALLAQLATGP